MSDVESLLQTRMIIGSMDCRTAPQTNTAAGRLKIWPDGLYRVSSRVGLSSLVGVVLMTGSGLRAPGEGRGVGSLWRLFVLSTLFSFVSFAIEVVASFGAGAGWQVGAVLGNQHVG